MRNVMKAATLESKFPILSVEHDCIISKDADITVCYRVELPELFTVTQAEYEAIHSAWAKAIKVLPNYSIVHKQDFFIEEIYTPELQKEDLSFLSRSFERHFNERPYLKHYCYLFLTKTTKEHSRTTSSFNALTRGFIIPKEMQDKEAVSRFLECCEQFERIINDSGFITLTRLTGDEITGTESTAGIIEKYFSLAQEDTTCLQDITLGAGEMKIGDNYLCLHTLSDPEDLPTSVATDSRYERLSTDRSDCRLSFAAPIGVLLTCNHIVNQYLFIDDSAEMLRKFEQTARNMHSLSRYSRSNQINREWIEEYLNEAHSQGLTAIRAHCNVFAWSNDREKLKRVKNDVGSQLALMEAKPRHNTVDTPTLFWAAIPGNAGDFPAEESFFTNHMVRQYYEQGTHVLLVDTGNSYQGLCNLINARKVQQTILLVGDITDIYVNSFERMLNDPYFTVEELSAIALGYTKLLEESAHLLNDLKTVVNENGLSMSDKDRMDIVDTCYSRMLEYHSLVQYYTNKNIGVSYLRAKKQNDVDRVMSLYGSPSERYW